MLCKKKKKPQYGQIRTHHKPTEKDYWKKRYNEIAQSYHRCYDAPVVILRNGLVYGPRMRKEIVIAKFLISALRNRSLIVKGGNQTRDPNYITNAGDAFLRVIEAPQEDVVGQVFHISYGKHVAILELITKCIGVTNSNSNILFEPYRPSEERMIHELDIRKARRVLGYRSKVDLDKGLRMTKDWLREEESVPIIETPSARAPTVQTLGQGED